MRCIYKTKREQTINMIDLNVACIYLIKVSIRMESIDVCKSIDNVHGLGNNITNNISSNVRVS